MNSNRKASREAGFTLIEIMVVIVIIGLLATIVVPNLVQQSDEAKITTAKANITKIKDIADLYRIKHSKIPTMEDLTTPDEKGDAMLPADSIKDPWDNDYVIRETDRGKYEVYSYGPDRQDGTDDDLISGRLNEKK